MWGTLTLLLVLALGIGRALLPWAVRHYVNRTLDRGENYSGKIGPVHIHLWRGAYAIQDIRISKNSGNMPEPFFAASRLDLSVEWDALLHGKIVGRIEMDHPELNFVDVPSEGETQTGAGGPWLQMIRDLFPFQINRAQIRDGTVRFRADDPKHPVNIYISHLDCTVDNLSNVRSDTSPLAAKVQATGNVMDDAKLDLKIKLDPFSYRPTFHLALRLLGLDVTQLNNLSLAYGKFDLKSGWFDLVVEADAKEGQMTGYVKPLFRNLVVFSLPEDIRKGNPLQFFWQALLGVTTRLFRNQPRDQFGTLIPFTGEASGTTSADILATIGNVLRNAFVRAYLPRLENAQSASEGLQFQAASFADTMSSSGTE